MKTVEEIQGGCRINEITDCWVWAGAVDRGAPKVRAPDYTRHEGRMVMQNGRRAVWHMLNEKPVPPGMRIYGTCDCAICVNPEHIKCGTAKEWGKHCAASNRLKGDIKRVAKSRETGRARSVVNAEVIREIQQSPETGRQLAARLGISVQTVSKSRRGLLTSFQSIGNPFVGLGARNV